MRNSKSIHYQFIDTRPRNKDYIVVHKRWRTIFFVSLALHVVIDIWTYHNYWKYKFYKERYEQLVIARTMKKC